MTKLTENKIVLCAVNSKFIHSSPAAYYLKEWAEKLYPKTFDIKIIQSSINETVDKILYSILKERPKIVCFGVYIWNVCVISQLCKNIKAINPKIKIILGGPEISYGFTHTSFVNNDFDYIVSGEGENAFCAALCLLEGIPTKINYTLNDKVISSPLIEALDNIPFIYNEENIHDFDNKIIYYESSRGCPFSCAYCLSSVCGKVRFLSLQRVFDDLKFFINHNVHQVKFVDRTFNCNKKRAFEIWKFIIENAALCDTNFHFEIGADLLNKESIDLLSSAPDGKIQLEIGIQSTNEDALKESCRYAPNEKIFESVKELKKAGNINLHTDLIAGLPYENFDSFKTGFNQVYALKAHQLQLGFLKLLNGAPLNNLTQKHGYKFSSHPPYEILKNKYISYDEICQLKEVEDCVEKLYNSNRFILSLEKLEEIFSTPYEMYWEFANFLREKNLIFSGISTKKLYDLLNEFSQSLNKSLQSTLLLDFYLSENSEVVPVTLKHLTGLSKFTKAKSSKILHQLNLQKEKKIFVKFINNTAFVIDYSKPDPVDGRFKLLCKKEVNFNE